MFAVCMLVHAFLHAGTALARPAGAQPNPPAGILCKGRACEQLSGQPEWPWPAMAGVSGGAAYEHYVGRGCAIAAAR